MNEDKRVRRRRRVMEKEGIDDDNKTGFVQGMEIKFGR